MNSIVNGATVYKTGSSDSSEASSIYPSLQDAIADANNIAVGDLFQTNGFWSSNDGGASRYIVRSTGTANGRNVVQLGANKFAVLQIIDSCYPEQLGYKKANSSYNLSDYIGYIIQLDVRHIKLHASDKYYRMSGTCAINSPDVFIEGSLDVYSGLSSRIEFTGTGTAFMLNHRNIKFKNVYFSTTTDKVTSICFDSGSSNFYGWCFENVWISEFGKGFNLVSGTHWNYKFENVVFSKCVIGMYCEVFSHLFYLNKVYTSHCVDHGLYLKTEPFGWVCENCNFGTDSNAIYIDYYQDPNEIRFGQIAFIGCSWEYDTDEVSIDNDSGFIYVADKVCIQLSFNACTFSLRRLFENGYTNARSLSFGDQTAATFMSCQGVKFIEQSIELQLWNENRPPKQSSKALVIINCYHFSTPVSYSSYEYVI